MQKFQSSQQHKHKVGCRIRTKDTRVWFETKMFRIIYGFNKDARKQTISNIT
jgi:cytidine deaminase